MILTKKSEKQNFAMILNPGWEGVKSIPKTGQSLPINGSAMRADLFEDPDSCFGVEHQNVRWREAKEVSDCDGLQKSWLEKPTVPKWKEETIFTQLQK